MMITHRKPWPVAASYYKASPLYGRELKKKNFKQVSPQITEVHQVYNDIAHAVSKCCHQFVLSRLSKLHLKW